MSFIRQKNFSKSLLLLDGLTGTGKTLFAPLLSSMGQVQLPRFEYMIEYLSIASKSGDISKNAASVLLNLLADTKCYDGMISREVNFRFNDLSSASSNKVFLKYFLQLFMPDGDDTLDRIKIEKPISCFVTHQLFSCKDVLFDAFGSRINIIEMVRHPLYLVDHWFSYQNRIGNHIRDLTICKSFNNKIYPWFADEWRIKYLKSNDFERVLLSISYLMDYIYKHQEKPYNKKQILIVPFEHFVLNPNPWMNLMTNKFNLHETNMTKKVMKAQMVPRNSLNDSPQKPIYRRYGVKKENKYLSDRLDYERRERLLKEQIKIYMPSKKTINMFMDSIEIYEYQFGLWFN